MTLAIAVRNNPIPKYGVTLSVTIDMIMQVIAAKAKMILAAIMNVFFVFFIFLSLLFDLACRKTCLAGLVFRRPETVFRGLGS